MAKCDKCIRGARVCTTGVAPADRTLKIDLGGAVVYIVPGSDGTIDVTVNAESLINGDYVVSLWSDGRWIVTGKKG